MAETQTPPRISLAVELTQRAGVFSDASHVDGLDSVLQNLYVEVDKETGRKFVVKRPGLATVSTPSWTGVGDPTGLFWFSTGDSGEGYLLGVSGTTLVPITASQANNNATGTAWSTATTPPFKARRDHCFVVFQDKMWVYGGIDAAANALTDIWNSPDGDRWTQVAGATPWGARQYGNMFVYAGKLYYIGGIANSVWYSDVWVSEDGTNWKQLVAAPPFTASAMIGVCVSNSGVFLVGGLTSTGNLAEVWFSSDCSTWTKLQSAPGWSARYDMTVIWNPNIQQLIMCGGRTSAGAGLNEVWTSPDGIQWTQQTAAWLTVSPLEARSVWYNGKIYTVVGDLANTTRVYSANNDLGSAWTLVATLAAQNGAQNMRLAVFNAPSSSSPLRVNTIYQSCGQSGFLGTPTNATLRMNINGAVAASWALSGAGSLPLQGVAFNQNKQFVMKDTDSMYVFNTNTLTRVTAVNYPKTTVPGVVNLNEMLYVMDPSGLIVGSAPYDALKWPTYNYIGADFESDPGVALAKYGNYIVAFGTKTIQFFYDSGSATLPVLKPQTNANLKIGCRWPLSVQEIDATLIFVGNGQTPDPDVFMFQGQTPVSIGTPFVRKILTQNFGTSGVNVRSGAFRLGGHSWYWLVDTLNDVAIVYDKTVNRWYRWLYAQNSFAFTNVTTNGTTIYMTTSGAFLGYKGVVTPFIDLYSDTIPGGGGTVPIDCMVITENGGFGNSNWKFCPMARIVGDTVSGSTANISFSDDDYQTWSTPQPIDLGTEEKQTTRLGRFKRRAWKITHSDATHPFRVEFLEFPDMTMGGR